jgi:diamine N-acetyltransferase
MIDGPRVRLRAWREADLAALTAWRNDAALQAQLLSRVRGSSEEQVRDWAIRRAAGPESLLLVIASIIDDKALGYLQLVGMNGADQRADLGICLAPGHQGAGLGREALALLLAHVRAQWPLRKIVLQVRSDNTRAIRCYESLGFGHCGRMREHTFIDGAYRDVMLMEHFLSR